ncbi:hypothetical protein AWN90_27920 [Nocardia terpenica]|uniref:Uncharacterized protein n=1 Tax=Nocardia terpenica TaxID=455432 RepID=A0A164LP50_9NOCA|nr:hypothetical protein AWN90_27920 [Nocardia terpenica]
MRWLRVCCRAPRGPRRPTAGCYAPRFGLYSVDVATDPTLTRHPTDAVAAYATLTHNGGVPADYRPTHPPVPCSQVDPPASCDEPVTVPPAAS